MSWITDALNKALKRSTSSESQGVVTPQGYSTEVSDWVPVRVNEDGQLLATETGRPLRQTQIGLDQTLTWENSAPAGTEKSFIISKPSKPVDKYQIIVYNPSTETDLAFNLYDIETDFGGADREIRVDMLLVDKNDGIYGTAKSTVEGILNGCACRIVATNAQGLTASGGFSAHVRIREV